MWTRYWEAVAVLIALIWCLTLATLGPLQFALYYERNRPEIQLPPQVEWAMGEEKRSGSDWQLSGHVIVEVSPSTIEPTIITYESTISSNAKTETYTRTIPPTVKSFAVPFDLGFRSTLETPEEVVLTLQKIDGASLGQKKTHTIRFPAQPASARLCASKTIFRESQDKRVECFVRLSRPVKQEVSFECVVYGDAIDNGFFSHSGTSITVAANQQKSSPIELKQLKPLDRVRTITIRLSSQDGGDEVVIGNPEEISISCYPAPKPIIKLALNKPTIDEGTTAVLTFTVENGDLSDAYTVDITRKGSASPTDVHWGTNSANQFSFTGKTATLDIQAIDDQIALEGSKSLQLFFSSSQAVVKPASIQLAIRDKQNRPQILLQQDREGSLSEGGKRIITATWVNARSAEKDITIPFELMNGTTATLGTDFTINPPASQGLLLPKGKKSGQITIVAQTDEDPEKEELVALQFQANEPIQLQNNIVRFGITDVPPLPKLTPGRVALLLFADAKLEQQSLDDLHKDSKAMLLGQAIILIHPQLEGRNWTPWKLGQSFPLTKAQLYQPVENQTLLTKQFQDQLSDLFTSLEQINTQHSENPPVPFVLWTGALLPNKFQTPANQPTGEQQELYFLWAGGTKAISQGKLEDLFKGHGRKELDPVRYYRDLPQALKSLRSILLFRF